jgi:hypothetical protein
MGGGIELGLDTPNIQDKETQTSPLHVSQPTYNCPTCQDLGHRAMEKCGHECNLRVGSV